MTSAAAQIVALLVQQGATLAVAESLTGGLLGALVTEPAGASAAFRGGVIAYTSEVKKALLGVPPTLLDREGAVHPQVAAAMAQGVRSLINSDYGLAVTGVAGPEPHDGKPVGTVHIALCGPENRLWHRDLRLTGSREAIRKGTCTHALALLRGVLEANTREHFR